MAYRSPLRMAQKRDTRKALIEAAVQLFFEQGTEGPSLDAICAEAGCTRGAFYVHFKTREELIIAAMEESLGEFLQRIMATNANTDDAGFVDAFLEAITSRAAHVGGSALRFRHLLDACARYPEIRRRYLLIVDASIASLRARLAKRNVPDANGRASVLALISMGLLAYVDLDREIDVDGVSRVVRQLVKAPQIKQKHGLKE